MPLQQFPNEPGEIIRDRKSGADYVVDSVVGVGIVGGILLTAYSLYTSKIDSFNFSRIEDITNQFLTIRKNPTKASSEQVVNSINKITENLVGGDATLRQEFDDPKMNSLLRWIRYALTDESIETGQVPAKLVSLAETMFNFEGIIPSVQQITTSLLAGDKSLLTEEAAEYAAKEIRGHLTQIAKNTNKKPPNSKREWRSFSGSFINADDVRKSPLAVLTKLQGDREITKRDRAVLQYLRETPAATLQNIFKGTPLESVRLITKKGEHAALSSSERLDRIGKAILRSYGVPIVPKDTWAASMSKQAKTAAKLKKGDTPIERIILNFLHDKKVPKVGELRARLYNNATAAQLRDKPLEFIGGWSRMPKERVPAISPALNVPKLLEAIKAQDIGPRTPVTVDMLKGTFFNDFLGRAKIGGDVPLRDNYEFAEQFAQEVNKIAPDKTITLSLEDLTQLSERIEAGQTIEAQEVLSALKKTPLDSQLEASSVLTDVNNTNLIDDPTNKVIVRANQIDQLGILQLERPDPNHVPLWRVEGRQDMYASLDALFEEQGKVDVNKLLYSLVHETDVPDVLAGKKHTPYLPLAPPDTPETPIASFKELVNWRASTGRVFKKSKTVSLVDEDIYGQAYATGKAMMLQLKGTNVKRIVGSDAERTVAQQIATMRELFSADKKVLLIDLETYKDPENNLWRLREATTRDVDGGVLLDVTDKGTKNRTRFEVNTLRRLAAQINESDYVVSHTNYDLVQLRRLADFHKEVLGDSYETVRHAFDLASKEKFTDASLLIQIGQFENEDIMLGNVSQEAYTIDQLKEAELHTSSKDTQQMAQMIKKEKDNILRNLDNLEAADSMDVFIKNPLSPYHGSILRVQEIIEELDETGKPTFAARLQIIKTSLDASGAMKLAAGREESYVAPNISALAAVLQRNAVPVDSKKWASELVDGPVKANWRVNDVDQEVSIESVLGRKDGETFYKVAGSETGVPESQLIFPDGRPITLADVRTSTISETSERWFRGLNPFSVTSEGFSNSFKVLAEGVGPQSQWRYSALGMVQEMVPTIKARTKARIKEQFDGIELTQLDIDNIRRRVTEQVLSEDPVLGPQIVAAEAEFRDKDIRPKTLVDEVRQAADMYFMDETYYALNYDVNLSSFARFRESSVGQSLLKAAHEEEYDKFILQYFKMMELGAEQASEVTPKHRIHLRLPEEITSKGKTMEFEGRRSIRDVASGINEYATRTAVDIVGRETKEADQFIQSLGFLEDDVPKIRGQVKTYLDALNESYMDLDKYKQAIQAFDELSTKYDLRDLSKFKTELVKKVSDDFFQGLSQQAEATGDEASKKLSLRLNQIYETNKNVGDPLFALKQSLAQGLDGDEDVRVLKGMLKEDVHTVNIDKLVEFYDRPENLTQLDDEVNEIFQYLNNPEFTDEGSQGFTKNEFFRRLHAQYKEGVADLQGPDLLKLSGSQMKPILRQLHEEGIGIRTVLNTEDTVVSPSMEAMHKTGLRAELQVGPDAHTIREATHRANVLGNKMLGPNVLGRLTVPLLAAGGVLALLAARSPQHSEAFSQGNKSDRMTDGGMGNYIAKYSERPGGTGVFNPIWFGQEAPFRLDVNISGYIANQKQQEDLQRTIFNSLTNNVEVRGTENLVHDERDKSQRMRAADILRRNY